MLPLGLEVICGGGICSWGDASLDTSLMVLCEWGLRSREVEICFLFVIGDEGKVAVRYSIDTEHFCGHSSVMTVRLRARLSQIKHVIDRLCILWLFVAALLLWWFAADETV